MKFNHLHNFKTAYLYPERLTARETVCLRHISCEGNQPPNSVTLLTSKDRFRHCDKSGFHLHHPKTAIMARRIIAPKPSVEHVHQIQSTIRAMEASFKGKNDPEKVLADEIEVR